MTHLDYFKFQAKKLFKDYKTKTPYFYEAIGDYLYEYHPKYFDINEIVVAYDIDENNFSLMKAQHVISLMAGFEKWSDLLKAQESELELAKLLIEHRDSIMVEDWEMYISSAERENNEVFDAESRLNIFKHVFLEID